MRTYGNTRLQEEEIVGLANADIAVPELGRIKLAVERVARARSDIECFLGRFYGSSECNGGAEGPEVDSYRNDISSLFAQVERLEKVVSSLGEIG